MCTVPTIDMKETGLNIARLRESRGVTVRQLQDYLGFNTPQAIYKWQYGKSIPSIDNLVILAKLFSISIEDILVINEEQQAA